MSLVRATRKRQTGKDGQEEMGSANRKGTKIDEMCHLLTDWI